MTKKPILTAVGIFSIFGILISSPGAIALEDGRAWLIEGKQVQLGQVRFHFTDRLATRLSVFGSYKANYEHPNFQASLPPCTKPDQQVCIESFAISGIEDDKWIYSTPIIKTTPNDVAFTTISLDGTQVVVNNRAYADSGDGMFEGSVPYIWENNVHSHKGGRQYMVTALTTGNYSRNESTKQISSSFTGGFYGLSMNVIPVGTGNGGQKILTEDRKPLTAYLFPDNVKVKTVLRMKPIINKIQPWFQARTTSPEFQIDAEAGKITAIGSPVNVSTATGTTPLSTFNGPLSNFWGGVAHLKSLQDARGYGTDMTENSGSIGIVDRFKKIQDFIDAKAEGDSFLWGYESTPYISPNNTACFNGGGVNGFMSTNATVYEPSPPTWDEESGSLDFAIAAPHLDSLGGEKIGTYNLSIKDSVARCLWGNAAISGKATVSVVNSDGTNQVATTTYGSDKGWVNFQAAGFHFSAPTVKVKLEALKINSDVPRQVTTRSIPKKIICIKGKSAKTLIGLNPKCPAGYKSK
jgi:hypothetical protein